MKNENSKWIKNAKMMNCEAVKWERDVLKKIDAY